MFENSLNLRFLKQLQKRQTIRNLTSSTKWLNRILTFLAFEQKKNTLGKWLQNPKLSELRKQNMLNNYLPSTELRNFKSIRKFLTPKTKFIIYNITPNRDEIIQIRFWVF